MLYKFWIILFMMYFHIFYEAEKQKDTVHHFHLPAHNIILWNIFLRSGTDPEETILNAFKIFDPEAKGSLKGEEYAFSSFSFQQDLESIATLS